MTLGVSCGTVVARQERVLSVCSLRTPFRSQRGLVSECPLVKLSYMSTYEFRTSTDCSNPNLGEVRRMTTEMS